MFMFARRPNRATSAEAAARVGPRMSKKFNIKYIRMILKKLIKKINKENAPPGGWKKTDKLSSLQALKQRHAGIEATSQGFKLQA